MEVFSLEEDDCCSLFIMQESKQNVNNVENVDKDSESCIPMDIYNENVGNVDHGCSSRIAVKDANEPVYSDISDPEDDFENPEGLKSKLIEM